MTRREDLENMVTGDSLFAEARFEVLTAKNGHPLN